MSPKPPTTSPDSPVAPVAPAAPQVVDLGRLGYSPAFERQRALHEQVVDGDAPPTVLLVEHDPVITLTPRKGVADHLVATPTQLAAAGVATHDTDRGGDITYHGPGQLVAYPILTLADYGLNLSKYMRLLEQTVIDTAGAFGVTAHREQGATGVWVPGEMGDGGFRMADDMKTSKPASFVALAPSPSEGEGWGGGRQSDPPTLNKRAAAPDPPPSPLPPSREGEPETTLPSMTSAKLCALGVRIRKNTTLHGLALNVTTDLEHFKLIVPCGLHGRPVTSLQQLLGDACPPMDEVKRVLVEKLSANLLASGKAVEGRGES